MQGKIYYIHTVAAGQTLYSICKAYGVTQNEIAQANPGQAIDVIKPGQVLKVPEKTVVHKNPETTNLAGESQNPSDTLKTYMVKQGDTLYNIARQYGRSVSEFIDANPDLKNGLKTGMALIIPSELNLGKINDALLTSAGKTVITYSIDKCDSISAHQTNRFLKVALMLPFHADELFLQDTTGTDSLPKTHAQNRTISMGISSLEFYQGFLIGLDSLKKEGINITLYSYDTKSDSNHVKQFLKELEIIKPDIIVGPVRNHNLALVSAFSKEHGIPLILPFTRANYAPTLKNPLAVFMLPDAATNQNTFSGYISGYNHSNIIVVSHNDTSDTDEYAILKTQLATVATAPQKNNTYKEIFINDTLPRSIYGSLKKDTNNIVILISNNEASVINIVSLLSMQDGHNIKLFGLPTWSRFNNLRPEYLHKLSTVVYLPYYIDYTKPVTKSFVSITRNKYGFEPHKTSFGGSNSNFVYLGFETCLLFGKNIVYYGKSMLNCICNLNPRLPQSDYSFRPLPDGEGFVNHSINLVEYKKDFSLTRSNYSYDAEIQSVVPLGITAPEGENEIFIVE
ncbi:MAG: LysM peptidoglycan-binding domain-containing protein [Bacteroidales bacterium]|nr:LysM peptidoglycan-binding domain-containing protein [Bacteroidales bacterium]